MIIYHFDMLPLLTVGLLIYFGWTAVSAFRQRQITIAGGAWTRPNQPKRYWFMLFVHVFGLIICAMLVFDLIFELDLRFWL